MKVRCLDCKHAHLGTLFHAYCDALSSCKKNPKIEKLYGAIYGEFQNIIYASISNKNKNGNCKDFELCTKWQKFWRGK